MLSHGLRVTSGAGLFLLRRVWSKEGCNKSCESIDTYKQTNKQTNSPKTAPMLSHGFRVTSGAGFARRIRLSTNQKAGKGPEFI